jgi:aspartate aminotransferase
VNSPHNPTGRIYRERELAALGEVLREASARNGRPIVLLSDESYNRIVFDRHRLPQPGGRLRPDDHDLHLWQDDAGTGPADRLRAVNPDFPDREAVGYRIFVQQLAAGWGFPNALLQHAISDLEGLSIDIGALQARRDRMVPALREMGYEVTNPEGTFYLMVRSPDPDDLAFLHAPRRRGSAGPAGCDRGEPWLVPDLTHGERRDGRNGDPHLPRDARLTSLR